MTNTKPMTNTTTRCPECGSELEFDPACVMDEPVMSGFSLRNGEHARRRRIAPAALCTGCEYCVELDATIAHSIRTADQRRAS